MSQKVMQFMEITGGSTNQANNFLNISNNDLDTAIMLFFESGDQPEQQNIAPEVTPTPPPQKLQQISQPKKGLFGFGKSKQETANVVPQNNNPPVQQKPYSNINSINNMQSKETKENKLFNGGGDKNSGSSTQFYQPPQGPYELLIHQYTNGCLIKDKFFDFQNPEYKQIFQELTQRSDVPKQLFEHLPKEDRPSEGQEIHATIQKNDVNFDYQKILSQQPDEKKVDWNPNETGRTLGVRQPSTNATSLPTQQNIPNLNFQVSGTKGDCKVRIRTQQVFTVTLDNNTTVAQMLQSLAKNGGLPGVQDPLTAQVKLATGQVINQNQTIEQSGIKGRQVMVAW